MGCNKTPFSPFGSAGKCSRAAGEMTGTPSGVVTIPGGRKGGLNGWGIIVAPSSVLSFKYIATWRRMVELRGPLSCWTAAVRKKKQYLFYFLHFIIYHDLKWFLFLVMNTIFIERQSFDIKMYLYVEDKSQHIMTLVISTGALIFISTLIQVLDRFKTCLPQVFLLPDEQLTLPASFRLNNRKTFE